LQVKLLLLTDLRLFCPATGKISA